jgi:hypothetical protein
MQNRMDAEQREWKYQLRRGEMVIVHEKLCAQHNLVSQNVNTCKRLECVRPNMSCNYLIDPLVSGMHPY